MLVWPCQDNLSAIALMVPAKAVLPNTPAVTIERNKRYFISAPCKVKTIYYVKEVSPQRQLIRITSK